MWVFPVEQKMDLFWIFSSKHIIPMTWWECFLVILLKDCRVGGALLCVWTFHLSARNTGCWPLYLRSSVVKCLSRSDLCRGMWCSRCLLPITHQSWCWGEAPIANAGTVLTEHKASMWQAAHWVLKPMRQLHLLPCFHGRPNQKETYALRHIVSVVMRPAFKICLR